MLGSKRGAGERATNNQRWPKANSYTSNLNYYCDKGGKEEK